MTTEFDVESGILRLEQSTFDFLTSWMSGAVVSGEDLEELRRAGVVVGERLHPDLATTFSAVTDQLCQFRVDWTNHEGKERTADGWVDADTVAMLYDSADGRRELVDAPATMLAAVLARLVRLGPRDHREAEPVHMSRDVFEMLFIGDRDNRQRAADRLGDVDAQPPVVQGLVEGPWRRWTISMLWTMPGGASASQSMQVVDGDEGLWWCEVSGAAASMWPTHATGIWRRLTMLLPDEIQE